jgi:DNA-binding XRE family transcriptional regulator
MTPDDIRAARETIGQSRGLGRAVTQRELAKLLGMGPHGWQAISAMENGRADIRTITALAITALCKP